jgi:hypothetical protein
MHVPPPPPPTHTHILTPFRHSHPQPHQTEFEKNKFLSMTKLVIRRWQPRFVSSANFMRRKNQLMKFAESLQSRIIRQEMILESSETDDAAQKQTQNLAMMAAETAVKRALAVSEKRHVDLMNTLTKVETATR